jgi:hypothetical protein
VIVSLALKELPIVDLKLVPIFGQSAGSQHQVSLEVLQIFFLSGKLLRLYLYSMKVGLVLNINDSDCLPEMIQVGLNVTKTIVQSRLGNDFLLDLMNTIFDGTKVLKETWSRVLLTFRSLDRRR